MITFEHAGKAYRNRKGKIEWIFRDFSAVFPEGVSTGILAPPGHGKTSFIEMAAGNIHPSEGRVSRHGRVSWPFGARTTMASKLSGKQNLRFLTDVYGRSFSEAYDFVEEFADLGRYLDMPIKRYSGEMKARLAISAMFAMKFNYILVDDTLGGGDTSFRKKCSDYIEQHRADLTFLIATSEPRVITKHCTHAGVLNNGVLTFYDTVETAIAEFEKINQVVV
jgi:capsular polysaccharide transport system ATP-binding protein